MRQRASFEVFVISFLAKNHPPKWLNQTASVVDSSPVDIFCWMLSTEYTRCNGIINDGERSNISKKNIPNALAIVESQIANSKRPKSKVWRPVHTKATDNN